MIAAHKARRCTGTFMKLICDSNREQAHIQKETPHLQTESAGRVWFAFNRSGWDNWDHCLTSKKKKFFFFFYIFYFGSRTCWHIWVWKEKPLGKKKKKKNCEGKHLTQLSANTVICSKLRNAPNKNKNNPFRNLLGDVVVVLRKWSVWKTTYRQENWSPVKPRALSVLTRKCLPLSVNIWTIYDIFYFQNKLYLIVC